MLSIFTHPYLPHLSPTVTKQGFIKVVSCSHFNYTWDSPLGEEVAPGLGMNLWFEDWQLGRQGFLNYGAIC